ncbi:PHD finger protein 14 [Phlyctochytrium planicorne]|nr:PHD finger protein 14 [Phlyctochytrium planicorne]
MIDADVCCICLEEEEDDDPVYSCSNQKCFTKVHDECYGIKFKKGWLCDACQSGDPDIMEFLDEERLGVKVLCHAYGCKNAVHITCAQAYHLLEDADNDEMVDPFFIYCKQHAPYDEPTLNPWASLVRKVERKGTDTPCSELSLKRVLFESFLSAKAEQENSIFRHQEELCRNLCRNHALTELSEKLLAEAKTVETNLAAAAEELADIEQRRQSAELSFGNILSLFSEDVELPKSGPLNNLVKVLRSTSTTSVLKEFSNIYYLTLESFTKESIAQPKKVGIRKRKRDSKGDVQSNGVGIKNCWKCHQATSAVYIIDVKYNWIDCDTCSHSFHWGCLDPPISRPKRRGYAWRFETYLFYSKTNISCEECDLNAMSSSSESTSVASEASQAAEVSRRSSKRLRFRTSKGE